MVFVVVNIILIVIVILLINIIVTTTIITIELSLSSNSSSSSLSKPRSPHGGCHPSPPSVISVTVICVISTGKHCTVTADMDLVLGSA